MVVTIASEGIGSIPRPVQLQDALAAGNIDEIEREQQAALIDTLLKLYEISDNGVYPISDGEQTKPSFVSYPIAKIPTLDPNGVVIPFEDGHTRQLPVITQGPFEYSTYAVEYFRAAKALAPVGAKIKQAIIAPSAISLLYPSEPIVNYSKEEFINDVVRCGVKDIQQLLDEGAETVQVDFTEGRLAMKLDPSGGLLRHFLDINQRVFNHFNDAQRQRIGIHSCPGADCDSTHSADVDYASILPSLFALNIGRFYLQLKSEHHPEEVLAIIAKSVQADQLVFVGVTDVNSSRVETADEIADFIELISKYIPVGHFGTTDDCGFSPFADDKSTAREIAFAKIKARIEGTKLAEQKLQLHNTAA